MRTLILTAAIAAILSCPLLSPASAQNTSPTSGAYRTSQPATATQPASSVNVAAFRIAVVDISRVFKNHTGFKATMDGMKNRMQSIEQELKAERDKVKQKEDQRNRYNVGTPEWKQQDNELTQLKGDFNVKMTQRQKDFLEQEAKAYYTTYLQVNDAVKYYAQRNQIGIVLRYSGDPVDPNRREDILRAINKPIVFQNQIDITDDIIASLNRSATTSPARSAGVPGRPATTVPRRR